MGKQEDINTYQINNSVMGVLSAVISSVGSSLITVAVQSQKFIYHGSNNLINITCAGENITDAAEKRSRIYANGVIKSGELAEREGILKQKLRLMNLEYQEKQAEERMKQGKNPEAPKETKEEPTVKYRSNKEHQESTNEKVSEN